MSTSARKIKVAIAGVGNCASALVQGIEYYRDADAQDRVPGLMHVSLGGYHVGDVEFVAAFDVDAAKVGLDLSKAVFASNNNTIRFAEIPALGVTVERGPPLDGLGKYYREVIEESPSPLVAIQPAVRQRMGEGVNERLRRGAVARNGAVDRRRHAGALRLRRWPTVHHRIGRREPG